jgi:hypothetical protein
MTSSPTSPKPSNAPPNPAAATWYVAGAVAAVIVAWLASLVHESGHAPVGLTSIGVGIALGITLTALATKLNVNCRKRLIVSTLIFAAITVIAEHAWLYLDYRRQWQEERARSAQVAIFAKAPASPRDYFAHELTPQSATLWTTDAILIAASSIATILFLKPPSDSPFPSSRAPG